MAIPRAVQEQADKADEYLKALDNSDDSTSDDVAVSEDIQEERDDSPPPVDWEHKFRVLQGKYDAEVPRLTQEIRQIKDQLEQAQQQKKQADEQSQRINFDELRDTESDEVVTTFQKQQEVIDRQNQIINDLRSRVDALGDNTAQSSERLFYSTLAQIVPDWEETNKDPRFLAWLSEMDPYTGATRQSLLQDAAKTMDAQRAAYFFTSWKGTVKKKKPPVSPNSSKSSIPPSDKPIYSAAEINQFAVDITRGKYRNNPKERERLEDEYTRAQMEGRIKP